MIWQWCGTSIRSCQFCKGNCICLRYPWELSVFQPYDEKIVSDISFLPEKSFRDIHTRSERSTSVMVAMHYSEKFCREWETDTSDVCESITLSARSKLLLNWLSKFYRSTVRQLNLKKKVSECISLEIRSAFTSFMIVFSAYFMLWPVSYDLLFSRWRAW